MKKIMVMVVALVFGVCSFAVACGGCGGYGFRGGAGLGFNAGYGPGSCCSFASNTQAPNCCLPGTPGFSRGNTNPGAAPGTIAPQTK
jgi:hypothetical protein